MTVGFSPQKGLTVSNLVELINNTVKVAYHKNIILRVTMEP